MLRISKATIRHYTQPVAEVLAELGEGWQLVYSNGENNIFKKFVYGEEQAE